MQINEQRQALKTFNEIDRTISNKLLQLAGNKERFLEACYFCYKNPKKAVTKKFIEIIKDCENKNTMS